MLFVVFIIRKIITMKISTAIVLGSVIFLSLSSCQKDNKSNQLSYRLGTNNRSVTLGTSASGISGAAARESGTAGLLTWTSGFINANMLKFEAKGPNGETEIRTPVNTRVDLFAAMASLGSVPVPPGTYQEVELKITLSPANGESALELQGNYNNIPVVFKVENPIDLEIEAHNFTIASNTDYSSLINLNLSRLTNGITGSALSSASLTNGTIIISAGNNVALYNILIANLRDCDDFELERD